MNTRKIWANLSVVDVEKTREFYMKLGFKPNGTNTSKEIASFLVGDDDFVIHFFAKDRFESDIEGKATDLNKSNEVMFTLSADSMEEVDKWGKEVKKAGGIVLFDPRKHENKMYEENGFYVCRFADPDGHLFNVFFNVNK